MGRYINRVPHSSGSNQLPSPKILRGIRVKPCISGCGRIAASGFATCVTSVDDVMEFAEGVQISVTVDAVGSPFTFSSKTSLQSARAQAYWNDCTVWID